ncbi:glycosyltransferase [Paludisphaera rhizosphaerae]|uniref:glycosyltransferase n=1 Tax=Paludisphaera rhizosphaerae TaxID=2711216 RepID=UPI001F0E805D|nr:glycosyltransferase [Paludisphaera rhizosphaerae]
MTPIPSGRPHFAAQSGQAAARTWRLDAPESLDGPSGPPPVLSVIAPAKNEAASLPRLAAEVAAALRPLCADGEPRGTRLGGFEILVIDDGSTDDTPAVLRGLEVDFPELRPIRLRANVGQSAATAAGFRAARGEWIATLDADLQNDPADLATLWRAIPGHDAALGWRRERQDKWSRRIVSRWANRVRNAALGQDVRDTGCSTRIFRRDLALRLPMFRGSHRFLGPLLLREGARIVQVPVNHRARPHGASHYNFRNRSFGVVVDLLGVAWLMRRSVRYDAFEPRGVDPNVASGESAVAAVPSRQVAGRRAG